MKSDYTYIAEVLDRSGSMISIAQATIDGHNEFLRAQKAQPGECGFMLVQFDSEYQQVYDGPIDAAPELNATTYVPRASTALLDAIGRTITGLGQKLAALPEADRPGKVLIVILTDGEENSSKRYTRKEIFDMITHQRDVWQWQFLFLGAGQDAIQEAGAIGISPQFAANYTTANVRQTYGQMTNKASVLRSHTGVGGQSLSTVMSWTPEERKKMEEEKK